MCNLTIAGTIPPIFLLPALELLQERSLCVRVICPSQRLWISSGSAFLPPPSPPPTHPLPAFPHLEIPPPHLQTRHGLHGLAENGCSVNGGRAQLF